MVKFNNISACVVIMNLVFETHAYRLHNTVVSLEHFG